MKKVIFGIILSISLINTSHARYITPLNGPGVEVTRVFIHRSGGISLYISGKVQNLDECTSTFRVYIPDDLPGKDLMLSVALTAKAAGKKIGLHGSNCSTTPFWGGTVDVPVVDNLWMF